MIRVAVIGAGLGGLTLGLALARAGIAVDLYEAAPQLREVGAGITLSPNARRVLDHLGLRAAIDAVHHVPGRQWTQHWQSGAVLRDQPRDADFAARHGAAYAHVHRADLHGLLVTAFSKAAPGHLHLGRTLVDITADGRARFADGGTIAADVVVGADGIRSAVRSLCFADPVPHFTGQVAWRGIVPVGRLPAAVRMLPPGIHVGPGRLFMRYPVRAATLLNYAAFVETNGWEAEGWSIASTNAELAAHFEGWDPAVGAIIAATPPGELYKWALHARDALPTWIAGRVTLLGDAAHAMLPFLGQGAATAIEDGMVLARCLTAFPADEALARYDATRRERTALVATQSRLLGQLFQGRDPAVLGTGPLMNEEALGLFDYDAMTVALAPASLAATAVAA